MKKKINAAGEREMAAHIRDIEAALKVMVRQCDDLKHSIKSKIHKGLSQDRMVMKDMKKADKKQ